MENLKTIKTFITFGNAEANLYHFGSDTNQDIYTRENALSQLISQDTFFKIRNR